MERWLAELAADEARRERRRLYLNDLVRHESATMLGHLVDIAERGDRITVDTHARAVHGRVVGVGPDAVVLADSGRRCVVAIPAVGALRTNTTDAPTGDRGPSLDMTLAEILYELAAERERVTVTTKAGQRIVGTLVTMGADILSVRLDGAEAHTAVVPLDAINDVAIS